MKFAEGPERWSTVKPQSWIAWIAPQLFAVTAAAKPGALAPPPTARLAHGALIQIDRPGKGEAPEDSDEATYHLDVYFDRDPDRATHEDKTRRLTDQNDLVRDQLLDMRPGEVRRFWYEEQNGDLCDHFGCAHGPDPYAARLELISVTPHHAKLPDDMHVTAWPQLGIRRGALWAQLSPAMIERIDDTQLGNGVVTIHFVSKNSIARETLALSLDALRARLEDASAKALLDHDKWNDAVHACDRAIALDPSRNEPYVRRAQARLALHQDQLAVESVAVVAARDPVWLYWKVMADGALAGLRTAPVITKLEASTPGTFDVSERACPRGPVLTQQPPCIIGVAEEPTGKFLVAIGGGVAVIDRQTGDVISRLEIQTDEVNGHTPEFLAAQRTIRALGFTPARGELAVMSYGDPEQGYPKHPRAVFAKSGYELVLATDRAVVVSPLRFVEMVPPAAMPVIAAIHIGALFIYRWGTGGMGAFSIVREPTH